MQFADTLSKTVGKHTFKAGADINVIHELLINLFQGGGLYAYQGSASQAFGRPELADDPQGGRARAVSGRHVRAPAEQRGRRGLQGRRELPERRRGGPAGRAWRRVAARLIGHVCSGVQSLCISVDDFEYFAQPAASDCPPRGGPVTRIGAATLRAEP